MLAMSIDKRGRVRMEIRYLPTLFASVRASAFTDGILFELAVPAWIWIALGLSAALIGASLLVLWFKKT